MKSILLLAVACVLSGSPVSTRAEDKAANTKAARQSNAALELEKEREAVKELLKVATKNHPAVQSRYRRINELEAQLTAFEKQSRASELTQAREDLQKMLITLTEKHPAVQAQKRKIKFLE